MGKVRGIIALIIFIALLLLFFPEYGQRVFQDKIYSIIALGAIFLISFLIWIKLRTKY